MAIENNLAIKKCIADALFLSSSGAFCSKTTHSLTPTPLSFNILAQVNPFEFLDNFLAIRR